MSDRTAQALITAAVGLGVVVAVRIASRRLLDRYERHLSTRDAQEAARRRTIAAIVARLSVAVVVVVFGWSLLSIFSETEKIAQAVLASGAVLALVIGLAVATPLANLGSGVLLAFTQPVRLGDRITVGDHTGVVEEITLSYTALVTDDERHVFVPNKDMVSTVIVNRSTLDPRRIVIVRLPVAIGRPLADARAAALDAASRTSLASQLSFSARVAEVAEKVVWLEVVAYAPPSTDVALVASEIRELALAALADGEFLPAA